MRQRIIAAREQQRARRSLNARLSQRGLARHCAPDPAAHRLIADAIDRGVRVRPRRPSRAPGRQDDRRSFGRGGRERYRASGSAAVPGLRSGPVREGILGPSPRSNHSGAGTRSSVLPSATSRRQPRATCKLAAGKTPYCLGPIPHLWDDTRNPAAVLVTVGSVGSEACRGVQGSLRSSLRPRCVLARLAYTWPREASLARGTPVHRASLPGSAKDHNG